jgi:hypothetical protein
VAGRPIARKPFEGEASFRTVLRIILLALLASGVMGIGLGLWLRALLGL